MVTSRKRPLVLVVEDDPALGDVMLTALKDDGLDAKLATDGDEAMRDVDDLSPSVMVLDLMMPKRDGSPSSASSGLMVVSRGFR